MMFWQVLKDLELKGVYPPEHISQLKMILCGNIVKTIKINVLTCPSGIVCETTECMRVIRYNFSQLVYKSPAQYSIHSIKMPVDHYHLTLFFTQRKLFA